MKLLNLILALALSASGQMMPSIVAGIPAPTGTGGPTLLSFGHASAGSQLGTATVTLNTTGATLLVIIAADYSIAYGGSTITDSNGNTWHSTVSNGNAQANVSIWYSYSHGGSALVTGAGHSIGISGAFSGAVVLAFSGTLTASDPLDSASNSASNTGTTSTLQPGSITPGSSGELVITGLAFKTSGASISGGISAVTDQIAYSSGANFAAAAAYTVQGSPTAINPLWTVSANDYLAAGIVAFKP